MKKLALLLTDLCPPMVNWSFLNFFSFVPDSLRLTNNSILLCRCNAAILDTRIFNSDRATVLPTTVQPQLELNLAHHENLEFLKTYDQYP